MRDALGNLCGSILSGQLYAAFARDMHRSDLMWLIFAILALGIAMLIYLYDKTGYKTKFCLTLQNLFEPPRQSLCQA